jgi:hypothetical protein
MAAGTLAQALPLVIAFLANLLGLGGMSIQNTVCISSILGQGVW